MAAAAWRRHAYSAAVDTYGDLDGAAEAASMLTHALADTTADGYKWQWRRFARYCEEEGVSALPAAPTTAVCYLGTVLRSGNVSPGSLQNYLSAINTRHASFGLPRPALGHLVHSARTGFARLFSADEGALPETRRPLPAPVMWRIFTVALNEPDFSGRVRWAALIAAFLVTRRTGEVLDLELGDVTVRPDGGVHSQVGFHKGAERRSRLERLTFDMHPARGGQYDPPLLVIRRLLADLHAARAPPSLILLAPPGMRRSPNSDDMKSWLQAALRRLGISAPSGVKWCSYSAAAAEPRL